jgi:hypothetical protein
MYKEESRCRFCMLVPVFRPSSRYILTQQLCFSLQVIKIVIVAKASINLRIMKFFALLPLATFIFGALSSPVSSVGLEQRDAADPLATIQQFNAYSKQYTDAIRPSLLPSCSYSLIPSFRQANIPLLHHIYLLYTFLTNNTQTRLLHLSLHLVTLPLFLRLLPLSLLLSKD